VLRRSFDKASGKSALHMVSAWGCEQHLVLAQITTGAKANEITAVPKLLKRLSLAGCTVTVDALTKVIPIDNILFASEMVGAVRGIDPTTNHHYDDTRRYINQVAALGETERRKIFA
jgi:hypothetical protein